MKKKNKTISKYLILSILFLVIGVSLGVLAIVLKTYALFFIIGLIVSLMASIGLLIVELVLSSKRNKLLNEDKDQIINCLDGLSMDEQRLSNLTSDDPKLRDIASKVNLLAVHGTYLQYQTIYKDENFYSEINKLISNGYLTSFGYVRLTNIYEDMFNDILEKYPHTYVYRNKHYVDLVVIDYGNKDNFEQFIVSYKAKNNKMKVVIAYFDECGFKDILNMMDEHIKDDKEHIHIIRKDERVKDFSSVIDKYRDVDISTEGMLDNFLKDMISYLPFTNIGVKVDEDYLRVVTYEGLTQLHMVDLSEYKYVKEMPLLTYKNKKVNVVFASKENIKLTEKEREKMHDFMSYLDNIVIYELSSLEVKEDKERYDRLEELSNNLSYEVNDEYKVIHASKRLSDRFSNVLVNHICYEVLYGREEPCLDCPLRKQINRDETFLLGSNTYKRIHVKNMESDTIFLLNKPKPYVPTKKELQNKLLGLLNTDSAKGYLLVFKLDALEDLANKNKVSVEELTKTIFKTLDIYGLTNNLYQKEVDEFVYILEDASVSDCINIAKQVSKCFLEKFPVNEDKEVSFIPKTLLLSYPLEVNTLFSLDSLCRSMFKTISMKGKLYRIDEEPIAIDNHRYYMEIVEQSYIKENIPFSFSQVKDLKGKENLSYISLNYVDDERMPIREDEITLYTKIDGTYLTLVERVIKNIHFDEINGKIIIPIGKEAMVKSLFLTIQGYLNSKKIPLNRIIFEGKEKDLFNNKEEVENIMNLGFVFSINIRDNNIYNLDLSKYRYVKLDGIKLEQDKAYQEKVTNILNKNVDIMINDKEKGVLSNVRYLS